MIIKEHFFIHYDLLWGKNSNIAFTCFLVITDSQGVVLRKSPKSTLLGDISNVHNITSFENKSVSTKNYFLFHF